MARYYAMFDHGYLTGSAPPALAELGNEAGTDNYFNRSFIGSTPAIGALLREGLIASRSVLSADAYQDIPAKYEDAGIGTIIPGDLVTVNNGANSVSWSFGYTASSAAPAGIRIPSNYRTRPTASVPSTDTRLGDQFTGGGVASSSYASASRAVTNVLNLAFNYPGMNFGNDEARTKHSFWHDYDLRYFAYDDFTPGTPTVDADIYFSTTTTASATGVYVILSASREYLNDWNTGASQSISASFIYATSSGGQFQGKNRIVNQPGDPGGAFTIIPLVQTQWTSSDTPGLFTRRWDVGTLLTSSTIGLDPLEKSTGAQLNIAVTFADPVIRTSSGSVGTDIKNSGFLCSVNNSIDEHPCALKLRN